MIAKKAFSNIATRRATKCRRCNWASIWRCADQAHLGDRSVIVDLPHRPNQVEFAAPGGISGDDGESMVNCPQNIRNQCGSVVKSTWSKVWLGGHDDEYKRSKSGKVRGGKKL